MYIHFGDALYGRVDRMTNGTFVATVFLHVYFLPYIPHKSFVVVHDGARGSSFRMSDFADIFLGVEIPLSMRSVLAAYGRVLSFIGIVIGWLILLWNAPGSFEDPSRLIPGASILAASLLTMISFWILPGFYNASFNREVELTLLVEKSRPTEIELT